MRTISAVPGGNKCDKVIFDDIDPGECVGKEQRDEGQSVVEYFHLVARRSQKSKEM